MDNGEQFQRWEKHEARFEGVNLAIETMWRAYSELNEWIRAADLKAGTVLATNGVIIIAAGALVVGTGSFTTIVLTHRPVGFFLLATLIAVIVSSIYAALCLTPILTPSPEVCLLFIGHLRRRYPTAKSYEDVVRTILPNPEANLREITDEVWNSAGNAERKLNYATWAIRYLIAALFCVLITLLLAYA